MVIPFKFRIFAHEIKNALVPTSRACVMIRRYILETTPGGVKVVEV